MAVEWVRIRRDRQWGDDDQPSIKSQTIYLVKCSTTADGPSVAAAACPAPSSGPGGGLRVISRDSKFFESTADGGELFEVTVDVSTKAKDPTQDEDNPLDRPPIMRLSYDSFEETVYKAPGPPTAVDADGTPVDISLSWKWKTAVCNSAGRPFDPSIVDVYKDPVITIDKNLASLPWDTSLDYSNTVNDDAFDIEYRGNVYSVAPGQGWLYEIISDPRFENDVAYDAVTVVLKIRKDGWKRKILDQGLEAYVGDDPDATRQPPPVKDKNGDPIQQPALLDGKGSPVGSPGAGTKPVFLVWLFKGEKSFKPLPFWK